MSTMIANNQVVPGWVTQLATSLRELPETIRKAEENAYAAQQKLLVANQTMRLAESVIAIAVAGATGADGKPQFSNETARNAECLARKQTDQAFLAAYKATRDLEEELATLKLEAAFQHDTFSAQRHLSDLYASWLRQA